MFTEEAHRSFRIDLFRNREKFLRSVVESEVPKKLRSASKIALGQTGIGQRCTFERVGGTLTIRGAMMTEAFVANPFASE